MKRTMSLVTVVAALTMLVAIGAWAGERVWVSQDGQRHDLAAGGHLLAHAEGADVFDVADLADGETRVLGQGVKQVTATRTDEEVLLTRAADGGSSALSVTCRLPGDQCQILTFADDPERVMIMIKKTRECENGMGDCDVDLDAMDLGEGGHRVIVRKTVECDADGNCEESEDVREHGASAGEMKILIEKVGDAGDGEVRVIHGGPAKAVFIAGDQVLLGCPEGDAKLHVDKDEADEVFLCPKHSLPMERIDKAGAHKVLIRRQKSPDSH